MNLFDPTGRMRAKRERQYISLRDMFLQNEINTVQAAENALERMRRHMMGMGVILLLAPLIALLLAPEAARLTALFAALLMVWLLATMINARRHVRRYIAEELEQRERDASGSA